MWNFSGILRLSLPCSGSTRLLHRAIPPGPITSPPDIENTDKIESDIDSETVQHLERLSLVDFADWRGVRRLREAVKLAQQLTAVNTKGVKPMYSVLEDRALYLRSDEVTEGSIRRQLLACAAVNSGDGYFVAPPGNIPLSPRELKLED